MCCACDVKTGKTFYDPRDGLWWWTGTGDNYNSFAAPIGYLDVLINRLPKSGRWKITLYRGNYIAYPIK